MRVVLKEWRGFALTTVAASVVVLCFSVASTVMGYREHGIVPGVASRVSNDIPPLVIARYEVDGRTYELRELHSGKGTPRKGDRIYVRYQVGSPQIARLIGVSAPWIEIMMTWIGGTVILLIYAYLCFVSVSERTQKNVSQKSAETGNLTALE